MFGVYFVSTGIGQFSCDTITPPDVSDSPLLAVIEAGAEILAGPLGWTVVKGEAVVDAPVAPLPPTLAQQAMAAMAAGLTVTLSGTITLAATVFPTDPVTTGKIGQVVLALGATGAFPGGAETYPLKDASGEWHVFTPAEYKAVATAIAAYVAPLDLIIDGNPLGATELPPSSIDLTV